MSVSEKTKRLAEKRRKLETELQTVRGQLFEAIRQDAQTGARQVDLIEASGYTREMVRRIVRGIAS